MVAVHLDALITGSSGAGVVASWLAAIAVAGGRPCASASRWGSRGPGGARGPGPLARAIADARAVGATGATGAIVAASAAELAAGAGRVQSARVAVIARADAERAGGTATAPSSVEEHLAALAQAVLGLAPGAVAVVGEEGGVADLFAEVAPPGVLVRRFGLAAGARAADVDLVASAVDWAGEDRAIATLAPGALAAALGGRLEVRAATALEVALALGAALAADALGHDAEAIAAGLRAPALGGLEVVARRPLVVVADARTSAERAAVDEALARLGARRVHAVEPDVATPAARRAAIARAVAAAGEGDAVALLGLGDAREVVADGARFAWSDAAAAREALARRGDDHPCGP